MDGYYVDFVVEGNEFFQDQVGVVDVIVQGGLGGVDVGGIVDVELIFVVVVQVVCFDDVGYVEFGDFGSQFVVVVDIGEWWQWNVQLLEQGFFVELVLGYGQCIWVWIYWYVFGQEVGVVCGNIFEIKCYYVYLCCECGQCGFVFEGGYLQWCYLGVIGIGSWVE